MIHNDHASCFGINLRKYDINCDIVLMWVLEAAFGYENVFVRPKHSNNVEQTLEIFAVTGPMPYRSGQ